jgi:coenzyme F420 hydrogenase subunit beta
VFDICTRACPRLGAWETDGELALHGRTHRPEEVYGIARGIWLARATHPELLDSGQDGGLVSALLIWGLESERIEGALCSRRSPVREWDAEPFLATTPAEVVEAAGSRYTYSANPLAMREAERRGLRRLALVGTGCQAAINGTLQARGVNKYARRIQLTMRRRSTGERVDIPLKQLRPFTREGCRCARTSRPRWPTSRSAGWASRMAGQ